MIKLNRVYHPVDEWEEIKFNMWGSVVSVQNFYSMAVEFTGDHILYGSYMNRVAREWPISCENALTDQLLNKKAWIGHAACALAFKCPESITRKAWKDLTDEQRYLANVQATKAIRRWEMSYIKSKNIRRNMAQQVLFK